MSLLRNSSPRRSAGLDVNGRFAAAVQAEDGRVERTVSAELDESFFRDGAVADVDGLGSALERFASETGLPKTVRVGVSNQQIAMRMIELPLIEDQKDLEAAVRFQAAEAIAMPLDEAILDHQVAETVDGPDGPRLKVVLVAARQTMVESLLAALRKAGLKVEGVDLDAFALVRMLAEDSPASSSAKAYCHLGGVANLAVASGRLCVFTRALSTRWDTEAAASDLAGEIRLSMDSYTSTPGSLPVTEVVLSGPGADDETLVEDLNSELALPTTVAPALGGLDPSAIPAGEEASRYTVAAGLALGAAA